MNDKVKGKKNIEQDEGIVKDTMVSRVFASVLDKMQFSQTRQLPPDDVLVGAKKKKKRRSKKSEPLSLDFSSVPKRRSRRNYGESANQRRGGNIKVTNQQHSAESDTPRSLFGSLGKFIKDIFSS
ncbi:MAG: hypothetical protein HN353_11040 [Bdellovibrionales bacterium]|nr:hypothetical protein [Bdellovibrionales bacterium]MBT3525197.1 hypothetical protein [Bdellovibrionales bacterium]MBT7668670.1 hypothetical protein [Bdellovibrionales bacterium]MBT7766546.1 hypothetical protein [Bdellovibrionales bacterium]